MIVNAPRYVPNAVIRKDLRTLLSVQSSPQRTPRRQSSEPHGLRRQKQAIAKEPSKLSSDQILNVIVYYVIQFM
jgi:hypothetical protein